MVLLVFISASFTLRWYTASSSLFSFTILDIWWCLAHTHKGLPNRFFLLLFWSNLLLVSHLFTLGVFYKNICHQMRGLTNALTSGQGKIIKLLLNGRKKWRLWHLFICQPWYESAFPSTQICLCWINKRFEPNGKFCSVFITVYKGRFRGSGWIAQRRCEMCFSLFVYQIAFPPLFCVSCLNWKSSRLYRSTWCWAHCSNGCVPVNPTLHLCTCSRKHVQMPQSNLKDLLDVPERSFVSPITPQASEYLNSIDFFGSFPVSFQTPPA